VNYVDIAILVLLALAIISGLRQGFIMMVAGILGAVVALGVARLEYADVRHILAQAVGHSPWLTVIAYLLVFLVVWGAIIVIARKIRLLARLFLLGWLDRLGGAIIGFLQGLIVADLLLYLGRRVPNKQLHHAVKHSLLGPAFAHAFPYISHWFPHIPVK
jgi:membrane protein required for colicin V production